MAQVDLRSEARLNYGWSSQSMDQETGLSNPWISLILMRDTACRLSLRKSALMTVFEVMTEVGIWRIDPTIKLG